MPHALWDFHYCKWSTMLLLLSTIAASIVLPIPNVFAKIAEAENGFCSKDGSGGHGCAGVERLSELEETWVGVDKLVFIESSGRDYLPPRYLCAVESALRFAGVPVVVAMTSPTLDADSHNGTRSIMDLFPGRLHFRYADPVRTLKESPFGGQAEAVLERIKSGEKWIQHLSDALRLAIIYKYGGWYSDLDTVWLRPLSSLSPSDVDVISTDGYLDKVLGKERDDEGHRILGSGVSNGLFRFRSAGSPFLRRSIELFVRRFDPKVWTSGGAKVMATAFKEACGVEGQYVALTVERFSAEKCGGLQLFDPKHFFLKSWFQATELLTPPLSVAEWESLFSESISVDFFQSSVANTNPIMRPKNYGKKMPAYAALGSTRCPIAFYSQRTF